MGKQLIHIVNEAWMKIEVQKLIEDKDRCVLIGATDDDIWQIMRLCSRLFPDKDTWNRINFITESVFKYYDGYIPFYYDSVYISHSVKDIFFKSALLQKCGTKNE